MGKINFTKEHQVALYNKATMALFNKQIFKGQVGSEYTIYDLLHNVSINSLKVMLNNLKKKIENAEADDEFMMTDSEQKAVEMMRSEKETLTLIIGYKRWQEELREQREKKLELQKQLADLKESQKTPEDKIKELESQIAELE